MQTCNPGLTIVKDPQGNSIVIPSKYLDSVSIYSGFIKEILTDPSYMINIACEGIYFFKLINWQINCMVHTRREGHCFIVEDCVENPTEDFVSNLLKKGSITSFG